MLFGYRLVATVVVVLVFSWLAFANANLENKSYRPLRYTHVVGQTDWYTCGAVAVATLLFYYYGDPTSEQEVSILEKFVNVYTGERFWRHTVTNARGDIVDGPHPRGYFSDRFREYSGIKGGRFY